MELLFDYLRIANALDVRLKDELPAHGVNEMQMWLLLLIGGFLRGAARERKTLSASDAAVELCLPRTRVSTQLTELKSRLLVVPAKPGSSTDRRTEDYVLSEIGLDLARGLRKLLQTIERDVLVSSGWRPSDRTMDPQYLVMGFWLTGNPRDRLPTLTKPANSPSEFVAGDERGGDAVRVKKAYRLSPAESR